MRMRPSACATGAAKARLNARVAAVSLYMEILVGLERQVAFDRSAIQLAAQMRSRAGRQMHQRAVIPEHHVMRRPAVPIHMLRLDTVCEQFAEQQAALVVGQANNAGGEMLADEQRLAAGLGMRAHDRMHYRLNLVDLCLRQRRAERTAAAQLFILRQIAVFRARPARRCAARPAACRRPDAYWRTAYRRLQPAALAR